MISVCLLKINIFVTLMILQSIYDIWIEYIL